MTAFRNSCVSPQIVRHIYKVVTEQTPWHKLSVALNLLYEASAVATFLKIRDPSV